jgi:AcrR family transcriptional regulator
VADKPLRADALRNREKVLRAARDAFAASGYGVPLDEIAARAGVGPGTVYRHFPSKEELFEAVAAARVRDLIDDARRRSGDADPGRAFFDFLGRIRQEAVAKRDMPEAIAIAGPLHDDMQAALDVLLRRAQQAGAVRPEITTPDIIALLKGLLRSINDAPPGPAGQSQADRLLTVVTDGLRPHPRPGAAPGATGIIPTP